jgi:exosome complex component RRP42
MAPSAVQQVLLSPAELAYLYSSLAQKPPIRPDLRSPTQFRPLVAESDILPGTNGSARMCFADGTEAVVGIKAEVERSTQTQIVLESASDEAGGDVDKSRTGSAQNGWVEFTVEIPGVRDDEGLPVFMAAMLSEALLADGEFTSRLYINSRFHWKLYVDVGSLRIEEVADPHRSCYSPPRCRIRSRCFRSPPFWR